MIFSIIGIIILWFIAGFVINFIAYNNVPPHLRGGNQTARTIHIIVNIITVIMILSKLFGD